MSSSRSRASAPACARLHHRLTPRRRARVAAALTVAALGLGAQVAAAAPASSTTPGTQLSITGTSFAIDGQVTHQGLANEGLLMNSRMINGIFDDANASTRWRWVYPDTQVWDPNRNTDELVAMLPTYHADGLDAITVGLQGGRPVLDRSVKQTWNVTAFNADGSLKAAWMGRLDKVLTAAAQNQMVVVVNLFYMAQDQRVTSDAGVAQACTNITRWLTTTGPHAPYTNVMIDVANEVNNTGTDATQRFDHANLTPSGVPALLDLIRSTSGGTIPVGTSFLSKSTPTNKVIAHSDVVFLHGNGLSSSTLASHIATVKGTTAYQSHPKPIMVNEDNSAGLTNLDTAVARHTGWGFFEAGSGTYTDGFQSIPANWRINDPVKRAFFDALAAMG